MSGRGSIGFRMAAGAIAVTGITLGVGATASGADPANAPEYDVDGGSARRRADPQTGEGCVF